MHVPAIIALCLVLTLTFALLTLKTFSAVASHIIFVSSFIEISTLEEIATRETDNGRTAYP